MRVVALITGLLLPASASAEDSAENLVMQLIFQDCMGYVTTLAEPFAGLPLTPLSPDVEATLPKAALLVANRKHVLSERYVAIWGEDDQTRYCMVNKNWGATQPMLLLVQPEGFLDRVTLRAAEFGLTETLLPETFTPIATTSWSEPGDNPDELRLVVMPTDATPDGALLDAGMIIVSSGRGRALVN